jgi:hypothetical protein
MYFGCKTAAKRGRLQIVESRCDGYQVRQQCVQCSTVRDENACPSRVGRSCPRLRLKVWPDSRLRSHPDASGRGAGQASQVRWMPVADQCEDLFDGRPLGATHKFYRLLGCPSLALSLRSGLPC